MVLLHVKRSEESLFLYQAPSSTPVGELIPRLVDIQNLRLKAGRLIEGESHYIIIIPF